MCTFKNPVYEYSYVMKPYLFKSNRPNGTIFPIHQMKPEVSETRESKMVTKLSVI